MDGIWNCYNLKSTGRIYTFSILKCTEKFKVLDLPQYISICAPFVALETSKRNSISCYIFWIMSRVTVSMADVILSGRCWIFLIFSAYIMFLMYPPQEKIRNIQHLPERITSAIETVTRDMIQKTWQEIEFSLDVSRATKGAHIEMYWGKSKTLNFSEHFKTQNV